MVLVIGSTGTVGKEVVKRLAKRGQRVRALLHHPAAAELFRSPFVETLPGDLAEPASLVPAFTGIRKVFLVTPSHPHQVLWERNAVIAAQRAGVEFIVKLSTLSADPASPILMSKWHGESEEFIRNSGIPHAFLRSHNFMQNLFEQVPEIVGKGVIRAPLKDAKLAMVDARDAAEVAVKILTEDQEDNLICRLTGPEAITCYDVAEILTDVAGKPVKYLDISFAEAERIMLRAGKPRWHVDDLLKLYRRFQEGKGERVWNDIPEMLGRPAGAFREFAQDHRAVFGSRSG